MSAHSAVVVSIDRLRAGWLGPYGNSWLDTPSFNRLAAQSLLAETVLADSPELEASCRAWWSGRHVMQPDAAPDLLLPNLAAAAGARTMLVTDDPEVADHPLTSGFGELQLVPQPTAAGNTHDVEETGLFRLFSAAMGTLEECAQPALVWIHARGMSAAWDAPLELRNQFADEDDPEPPKLTEPPNQKLALGFDPDEVLGFVQAYAGQVALADMCLEVLLAALDAHPLAEQTLFALTSPRGFPLGEHRRVGPCDMALYGELLQVPLFVRFPQKQHALARTQQIVQPHELFALIAESCGWTSSDGLRRSTLLAELRGDEPPARIACSIGPRQRAIRTPAWFLREDRSDGSPRRELFAKPDDRWEANEVSSRCSDEVELLAAELDRFEEAARAGQLAQIAPLPPRLCELWR